VTDLVRDYLEVAERRPWEALLGVDWNHLPALVKRYDRARAVAAPGALAPALRRSYGLTRLQWDAWHSIAGQAGLDELSMGRALRPVPSGGGLFPAELYAVGALPGLPAGAYHYDPAADALDPVRAGARLQDAPLCLVITGVHARTVFKYKEFGYRLECLDAGVLAGQLLTMLAAAGLPGRLLLDTDDARIAATLGLDPEAEAVLAVIGVSGVADEPRSTVDDRPAEPMPRTRPHRPLDRLPLMAALCAADRAPVRAPEPAGLVPGGDRGTVPLPPDLGLSLVDGAERRRSVDARFGTAPTALDQLAAVVRAAGSQARHTLVYCVVHRVAGVPPGLYVYDSADDVLRVVREGDMRAAVLPDASRLALLGDHGGGATIYLVGDYEAGLAGWGSRWFRTVNVLAGVSVQRAVLAATAGGLGTRIACSYDTDQVVSALELLGTQLRPLIELTVGPVAGTVSYAQSLEVPW
jgi:SagB-type dehydrogenase family enzyme